MASSWSPHSQARAPGCAAVWPPSRPSADLTRPRRRHQPVWAGASTATVRPHEAPSVDLTRPQCHPPVWDRASTATRSPSEMPLVGLPRPAQRHPPLWSVAPMATASPSETPSGELARTRTHHPPVARASTATASPSETPWRRADAGATWGSSRTATDRAGLWRSAARKRVPLPQPDAVPVGDSAHGSPPANAAWGSSTCQAAARAAPGEGDGPRPAPGRPTPGRWPSCSGCSRRRRGGCHWPLQEAPRTQGGCRAAALPAAPVARSTETRYPGAP